MTVAGQAILLAALAHGVEVLEREAERIHHAVAAKQLGFSRCRAICAFSVFGFSPGFASFSASTFGGGDAGGVPLMRSSIHAPRSTGAVRFGYDVSISTPPLPSRPQRFESVSVDAAALIALHVLDAVVKRETLVQVRVVRRRAGPCTLRSSRNTLSMKRRSSVAEVRHADRRRTGRCSRPARSRRACRC